MDVRVGPQRRLSTEELILLNCGVGQDSWEFLGLQETKPVDPKGNQSWIFIGRTDAEAEAPILWPHDMNRQLTGKDPTHWKRPWCWERLKVGEEGDDRGWEGWIAIPNSVDMSLSELREIVKDREAWHSVVHRVAKSQTGLSNWTTTFTLNSYKLHIKIFYWSIVDLQHFRYTAKWFFLRFFPL